MLFLEGWGQKLNSEKLHFLELWKYIHIYILKKVEKFLMGTSFTILWFIWLGKQNKHIAAFKVLHKIIRKNELCPQFLEKEREREEKKKSAAMQAVNSFCVNSRHRPRPSSKMSHCESHQSYFCFESIARHCVNIQPVVNLAMAGKTRVSMVAPQQHLWCLCATNKLGRLSQIH